ncbi:prepilin-type N-terminal cleavage/methylation domain-containing protein [uncultured Desulfobacter sp.]|uniref:prepilin-type N-terminal cleavage/methylation domain-containing protein n=1 Tax=uncultured Desulfobacter sp. TaxID=240139 RepID=UPI0029C80609|nr:prepilin-type N-terminal cleavage/methylation domain-containing protein [uncultured Desulfobacter sp.]
MKKYISPCRGNAGFTLIETLIALAISGILMGGVYAQFISQQDSYLAQDQVVEMQQNLRAGISYMTQELRMAGYDPYSSGTAGIETANPTSVVFTYVADDDNLDNDNADGDNDTSTGADETGELQTVTFDLYDAYGDGDNDIGRQAGASASTKRAIAENIENLEFRYLDADGAVETDPNEIKTVQISILARVGKRDRKFFNNMTYTSASGAAWGPYNDGFRRRFQIVTIHLRNAEI